MAKNLLHSMAHFFEISEKILEKCSPQHIVEVGSEYAGSTRMLASFAEAKGCRLTVVDPSPKEEAEGFLGGGLGGKCRFLRASSIDVLSELKGDIIFLDGDHNYWTVNSELNLIYSANPNAWVLLHDVGFPCDRRDQYYSPGRIPSEYLHPHSYDYGIDLRTGELRMKSGFWGAGEYAIALEYGGKKNGVLTAVEDFMEIHPELRFESIPLIFGLGVVAPLAHADFISEVFAPYQGALCRDLERNRLELYGDYLELTHLVLKNRRTMLRRWINRLMDFMGV